MRSVTAPSKLSLQALARPNRSLAIDLDGIMHGGVEVSATDAAVAHATKIAPTPEPSVSAPAADASNASSLQKTMPEDASKTVVQEETSDSVPSAITEDSDRHHLSEDDSVEQRVMGTVSTPPLDSDAEVRAWGEAVTPPETVRLRHPRKAALYRTISEDILGSRTASSKKLHRTPSRESQNRLADGLVRKTYTILISPPSYLVMIMLQMAAKIANGALSMTIESPSGAPKRIPGSWNLSDGEDDWDTDDRRDPFDSDTGLRRGSVPVEEACEVE